ncbi:unnamed protein product [Brachionus calyciflorus]|uniref:Integrator complex subunit 14 n=1 Tax=Brachionus calyciflorus TaxID=104777 RepID=A0A813WQG7_9BILA|nr:unnamed protein product [Brachionus calyciflorus]
MPVVIILDNSLSMFQNVTHGQKTTKKDLACLIAQKIIDQISKNDKQEFISLIAVSSTVQVLCDFTRDFTKLGESLNLLKPGDSFNLESSLTKLNDMVLDTWGCFTNISIILITDEIDNLNQEHSIKNFYLKLKENKAILKSLYDSIGVDYDEENFSKNSILNEDLQSLNVNFDFNKKLSNTVIPFSFPNRFDVICLNRICTLTDRTNQESMRFGFDDENFKYKIIKLSDTEKNGKINFLSEILKLNSSVGKVHVIESLDKNFIENEFLPDVLNQLLEPHDFELKCGNLKSLVNLVPSPINKGYVLISF